MLKQFRVLPCLGTVLLVAASLPEAQPPQANRIHVEITGLRDDKGQVLCTLYSSPAGFPRNADKAAAHSSSAISHGRAVCEFSGMTAGSYASPARVWALRITPKGISGPRNSKRQRFNSRAAGSI